VTVFRHLSGSLSVEVDHQWSDGGTFSLPQFHA
jgi:hypothetical protein